MVIVVMLGNGRRPEIRPGASKSARDMMSCYTMQRSSVKQHPSLSVPVGTSTPTLVSRSTNSSLPRPQALGVSRAGFQGRGTVQWSRKLLPVPSGRVVGAFE